jgi:uncharacterized oligopeptide transporter (OPT) family protein
LGNTESCRKKVTLKAYVIASLDVSIILGASKARMGLKLGKLRFGTTYLPPNWARKY